MTAHGRRTTAARLGLLSMTVVLAACLPGTPARSEGDSPPAPPAFSAAPLYHDQGQWTAPGVEAALVLTSPHPRFGGWSGLSLTGDRLVAVSDRGYWFTGTLETDARTGPTVDGTAFGALGGLDGQPLGDPILRDAEALVALPDGGHLVAFEREHRIWYYPPATPDAPFAGPARAVTPPPGLENAPVNGGVETLALLADGRLVAIIEGDSGHGPTMGWLGTRPDPDTMPHRVDWQPLTMALRNGFRPTGAAIAANGDLLVVERYFSIPLGFASRIRRINADALRPGATLDGPVVFRMNGPPVNDNFEGITTAHMPDGTTRVLVISDDNYSSLQRSLLLVLRL